MQSGVQRKWGLAGLAAGLLAAAGVTAQEPACRADDVSCWYLVEGAGDPPSRIVWLARRLDVAAAAHPGAIELVQVQESPRASQPYAIRRLQVDCAAQAFRTEDAWLAARDGLLQRQPPSRDWIPAAEARHGESAALAFACDPDVALGRSSEHAALFVGNAWRAPDAVREFRLAFWEQDAGAP